MPLSLSARAAIKEKEKEKRALDKQNGVEGVSKTEKTLVTEIHVKRISPFVKFLDNTKETLVIYGGAGSGKSVAVAQRLCEKFIKEDGIDILVTRKTTPSLKIPKAPWPLMNDILDAWDIPGVKKNKTSLTLDYRNNKITFKATDNPEKFKSSEYDYIWIEEATDFTKEDFQMLRMRLGRSAKTKHPQMYLTFNPVNAFHWCITDLVNKPSKTVAVMHSDHTMNPFVPKHYRDQLENLKNEDLNKWRVYAKGLPGMLENIIYTNWEVLERKAWPEKIRNRLPDKAGMDFGTVDPRVLLSIWVDTERRTLYVHQEFYRTGTTNIQMIEWMTNERDYPRGVPIFGDPSAKDSIMDISNAGFLIYKANNAVKEGISYVSGWHIVISPDSVETIEEMQNYSRRKDRDGHVLEEPVKFRDHAMDSLRYGAFTEREDEGSVDLPDPYAGIGGSGVPTMYKGKGIPGMKK